MGRQPGPVHHQPDRLLAVEGERDRAPQSDLLGCKAADHGIAHVEGVEPDRGVHVAERLHARAREVRGELAVGHGHQTEIRRDGHHHVELAPQERQPHRLVLDGVDELDAIERGQPAALEELLAVIGIPLENLAASGLLGDEHEGTRPHGVTAHVVAIEVDHLARRRGEVLLREHVQEVEIRLVERDPQRVAIEDLQALDRFRVVERRPSERALAQRVGPRDLAVDDEELARLPVRIEEPPDAVGVICRDQLARLALERRIGSEEDSFLQPAHVDAAALAHLGHRLKRRRDELERPRDVVVAQHRLHQVLDHVGGLDAVHLRGVEGIAANGLLGDVQDLEPCGRWRIRCANGGPCRDPRKREAARQGARQGGDRSTTGHAADSSTDSVE